MFDSALQQPRALRTTVPSAIVEQFGFNAGDKLMHACLCVVEKLQTGSKISESLGACSCHIQHARTPREGNVSSVAFGIATSDKSCFMRMHVQKSREWRGVNKRA